MKRKKVLSQFPVNLPVDPQQLPRKQQQGMGPGGTCVCPKCNHKLPHVTGIACASIQCPNCNSSFMIRDIITDVVSRVVE
jgi:DNA-directed RNA polymerase subunit RPC12/RpoP